MGSSVGEFWSALTGGRDGFAPVASFDTEGYRTRVGAEVKEKIPREAFQFAREAARQALADSRLELGALDLSGFGVALGTTSGETNKIDEMVPFRMAGDLEKFRRETFRHFPASVPARLAAEFGLRGPNIMLTTACAAGNYALSFAFDRIGSGAAELMLAGGVDVFARIVFAGFNRLLSVAPEFCAPFSPGRKGLIPAEGCGLLVLEERERALARGARIYAEMLGYGLSSDAKHVTMPDPGGVARAISDCLARSGLTPAEVDYISAHGTGTPANDKTETAAVKAVFGERARAVPISSIKSMLGHAMGAASALEAAACCLALDTGVIPPTAHHAPGDPDCDLDYVPEKARKADPKIVLSNAFAFGGSNCVIALARPDAVRPPLPAPKFRVAVTGWSSIEDSDPLGLAERLLPEKDLRYLDEPMAYALCAVKKALDHAGLELGPEGSDGVGIVADTTGEVESQFLFYKELITGGPDAVEPRFFPNILANAATSRAAILFGLRMANVSIGGCFPGGESSVSLAFELLRRRGKGVLLAGGVDAGAAMLVLEPWEAAAARGASIRAELVSCRESFSPLPEPRAGLGCFCLVRALEMFSDGAQDRLCFRGRGTWGGEIVLEFLRPSVVG